MADPFLGAGGDFSRRPQGRAEIGAELCRLDPEHSLPSQCVIDGRFRDEQLSSVIGEDYRDFVTGPEVIEDGECLLFGVVKPWMVAGPVIHAQRVIEYQHNGARHATAPPIRRFGGNDRPGRCEGEEGKDETAQQQEQQILDAGAARGFRLYQLEKAQCAEWNLDDALALQ